METLQCDVVAVVTLRGGGIKRTRHDPRHCCWCSKPVLVFHLKLLFVHSKRVSNVSAVLILIVLTLILTIIIIIIIIIIIKSILREGIGVV
jgi:hypothetical protein